MQAQVACRCKPGVKLQWQNPAWALNAKHQNSQHYQVQHFLQTIHFKVNTQTFTKTDWQMQLTVNALEAQTTEQRQPNLLQPCVAGTNWCLQVLYPLLLPLSKGCAISTWISRGRQKSNARGQNSISEIMGVQCSTAIFKRDLLSLLGHLNFAMCVIVQGRSFISKLLDLSKTENNLSDMVSLEECRSELQFWSLLLEKWNGISLFYHDVLECSFEIWLFSALNSAMNHWWFADKWPKELSSLPNSITSSALLEMYPIVIACLLWGKHWSRKGLSHCLFLLF